MPTWTDIVIDRKAECTTDQESLAGGEDNSEPSDPPECIPSHSVQVKPDYRDWF